MALQTPAMLAFTSRRLPAGWPSCAETGWPNAAAQVTRDGGTCVATTNADDISVPVIELHDAARSCWPYTGRLRARARRPGKHFAPRFRRSGAESDKEWSRIRAIAVPHCLRVCAFRAHTQTASWTSPVEAEEDDTGERLTTMSCVEAGSDQPAGPPKPSRRRWGPGKLLVLIKGVLAGVGAVYLATGSVVVTLIAGAVAVLVLARVLSRR
jgi:hypothetical protein